MENVGKPWERNGIFQAITSGLHAHRDRYKAQGMSAYMRNQFPFLGISTPARRKVVTDALHGYLKPNQDELVELARALHELPEREFQSAGVDVLVHYKHSIDPTFLNESAEFFITHKSWWDSVDALNPLIRHLVYTNPASVPLMYQWITNDNMWVVRCSLTHQLTMKKDTDAQRLADLCSTRAADTEFFIAKAVGWALRDYSHSNPEWVRGYVDSHAELSPLARREALKAIERARVKRPRVSP